MNTSIVSAVTGRQPRPVPLQMAVHEPEDARDPTTNPRAWHIALGLLFGGATVAGAVAGYMIKGCLIGVCG